MALRYIRKFIQLESSAGLVLFLAAVLAMIVDNTPLSAYYDKFISAPSVLLWINDGLMSLFFLLIGLEMKREILEDGSDIVKKITLPVIGAIGGMLFPTIIYLFFNWHDGVAIKGWAIPTATDTAFSLGVLSLLGKRIPSSLKLFLMTLAIFDDLGAIIVIAIFYTSHISLYYLIGVFFRNGNY